MSTPVRPIRYPGRQFQLWTYTVGHGQLLLRSTKSDEHATRCEILFKNVKRVDLPVLMDDLEVEVAAGADVPVHATEPGGYDFADCNTYRVRRRGFTGYVVAGAVACAEDEGEYFTPSTLLSGPRV